MSLGGGGRPPMLLLGGLHPPAPSCTTSSFAVPWGCYTFFFCKHASRSEVGGVSPTGKSFRVVRACVRSGCLVRSGVQMVVWRFPFSLFPPAGFPFSLVRSSESR